MTLTTTLNDIRRRRPCKTGWEKLLASLGKTQADDDPLPFRAILESNGLGDALWCLRALPEQHESAVRLLACDLVEPALRFVPEGEDRPRQAVEIARAYARGQATKKKLAAAWVAAGAAADASSSDAEWAAARAAVRAAAQIVSAGVYDAAADAAGSAAEAAAKSAANRTAAWIAARENQVRIFRAWLDTFDQGNAA